VRPGGTIAMLEFALPHGGWRVAWESWVRVGLPGLGRLISPGWHEVGRVLGPTIRALPTPERLADVWREAGIDDVNVRGLSLGGGVVMWGRRR